MQKKILRICSAVVLIAIIIVSIYRVSNLLELKASDSRYASYFTEKQSIDVIFLGSSHVRHGFFAMELWNDYGISAYNLAANGSTMAVSYWTLVNALDYQKPKVVVMDVYDCWPGRVFSTSWGQVHGQFDAFPLSFHKAEMVMDLFNNPDLTDGNGNYIYNKRWEMFWNLGEYHTRWTELQEDDFDSEKEIISNSRIWKGSSPLINVVPREIHVYGELEDELVYDQLSRDYLEKMIELCDAKGIKLLLINTGYDCSDEAKLFHDSVAQIAEENDLVYLDFTEEDIIDFDTDLCTSGHNTHVNFSGAERFSEYIGNVLYQNYNIEDHRQDNNYSQWWDDYNEFVESKHICLLDQNEILLYMMLLNDDDYQLIFEVRDLSILKDDSIASMVKTFGVDLYQGNNLWVIDVENDKVDCINNEYISGSAWETNIGKISLWVGENNIYGIYLNDGELYTVNPDEDNSRLKIAVYSKHNGMFIDIRSFE